MHNRENIHDLNLFIKKLKSKSQQTKQKTISYNLPFTKRHIKNNMFSNNNIKSITLTEIADNADNESPKEKNYNTVNNGLSTIKRKSIKKCYFRRVKLPLNNLNISSSINTNNFDSLSNRNSSNPFQKRNTGNKINKNDHGYKSFEFVRNNNNTFRSNINTETLNLNIGNFNLKNKELINLNNILQNQNKNLRLLIRDLRNKIKDLVNNNKSLLKDKKVLLNEKNKFLINISNLENELDTEKKVFMNKLELKENTISQMSEDISKLYNILEEKETEIINIKNLNSNNNENKTKILESIEEKINSSDSNDLLIQNIQFTREMENLKEENQKLKQNNKSIKYSEENLKKELKKYKTLFFKEYHEKEYLKKMVINIQENAKNGQDYSKIIKQLNSKLNLLMNENKTLKQAMNNKNSNTNPNEKNNFQNLQNENNTLKNKLKLKQKEINFLQNQNNNLQKNNEILKINMEQRQTQISTLESDINNYKSKIKDLNNSNNSSQKKEINNEQFDKLLKQSQKEKSDLNNIILNLKSQINELENEQHNYVLQISKMNTLEKDLNKIKKENESNYNELKRKQNENIKLVNIIKNKDKEIEDLQKNNQKLNNDSIHSDNDTDINKNIELNEKNAKLMLENAQLKEKIQLMQSDQDEGLMITIDNLKEELKDKNLQINNLIKENKALKDFDKRFSESSLAKINSKELNEQEKIKLYKDQIKELKILDDSDKNQIKALKEDIKTCQNKLQLMNTFNGQLKDFNEFINLFNIAMTNYKPKKKEQKEAFNKLIEVMNNLKL